MTESEIHAAIVRAETEAHTFLALVTLRNQRDKLQMQVSCCPCCTPPEPEPEPEPEAKLLLTEDFDGCAVTAEHLEHYSSTPDAYRGPIQPFVTYSGKSCGHYYAQEGTNEQTPWEVLINTEVVPDVTGEDSFAELCLEWQEHFAGGYPWASSGQKMLRLIYDDGRHPESRKSFDLACLNDGVNLQAAAYIGNGDAWFQNSGERHPEDAWVKWRVWIKMNTQGQSDGFVRITKNGYPFMGGENVKLRNEDDSKGYNSWWLGGNYSQMGGVGGLAHNGHRYITGIRWWTTNPDAA